jgi:hypothetical protein
MRSYSRTATRIDRLAKAPCPECRNRPPIVFVHEIAGEDAPEPPLSPAESRCSHCGRRTAPRVIHIIHEQA